MNNLVHKKLIIDPSLERLMLPCTTIEYEYLKHQIVYNRKYPTIIIWNNYVLKGFSEYRICQEWHLPFKIKYKKFESHMEATIWLCLEAIKRQKNRSMTKAHLRYCIGKLYLEQKKIPITDLNKNKMYSSVLQEKSFDNNKYINRNIVSTLLKPYISCSSNCVYRYSIYANAIDILSEKTPDIVSEILYGTYTLSQKNIIKLSTASSDEIIFKYNKLKKSMQSSASEQNIPTKIQTSFEYDVQKAYKKTTPEIKKMPIYDPDAEVASVTLTIPMWMNSIKRVQNIADFKKVSIEALNNLEVQLQRLTTQITDLQQYIQEEYYERNRK